GDAKVSVLSQGTQTVMPPSRHRTGTQYTWQPRHGPADLEPAVAPAWLHTAGREPHASNVIAEGERNRRLFKMACAMRRFGATDEEILTMVTIINKRCVPPLPDEELQTIARSASKYAPS